MVLSVRNIDIKINGERKVASETGFEVRSGDVVLLSGKNGCGKSGSQIEVGKRLFFITQVSRPFYKIVSR